MQGLHKETDPGALADSETLLHFVRESMHGKRPYFWLSERPKKAKFSHKAVGDSFKARVFDTKRDALVLVYHPIAHKNRGLKEKFDELAQSVDQDKLLLVRYNGVNESAVFKNPHKLPALVHFTSSHELEASKGQDAAEGN